jgi:hypothetical protein
MPACARLIFGRGVVTASGRRRRARSTPLARGLVKQTSLQNDYVNEPSPGQAEYVNWDVTYGMV